MKAIENHPPAASRPGRWKRILARVCIAICGLDLVLQDALSVTGHHPVIGGPLIPSIGALGALAYLRLARRR